MARTYWQNKGNGSWEFLGAFADGHKANPKQPQGAKGVGILDVPDRDVNHFQALTDGRETPLMFAPQKPILKWWNALAPASAPWAQVEGSIK